MTREDTLLAAAKALLSLELDQEGCTADGDEMIDAIGTLREAVAQYAPADAPLLTLANIQTPTWKAV